MWSEHLSWCFPSSGGFRSKRRHWKVRSLWSMTHPKMRKSFEGPSWKDVKQKNTASNMTLQRCKRNAGSKWHHCAKVDSRTWQQANISPVQPREFVEFSSNDLTLENLKIACVEHFGYLVGSCDVLVPNKGPSCTNIKVQCKLNPSSSLPQSAFFGQLKAKYLE